MEIGGDHPWVLACFNGDLPEAKRLLADNPGLLTATVENDEGCIFTSFSAALMGPTWDVAYWLLDQPGLNLKPKPRL